MREVQDAATVAGRDHVPPLHTGAVRSRDGCDVHAVVDTAGEATPMTTRREREYDPKLFRMGEWVVMPDTPTAGTLRPFPDRPPWPTIVAADEDSITVEWI
jgi:hypothetical protein